MSDDLQKEMKIHSIKEKSSKKQVDRAQLFELYNTQLHEDLWRYILSYVRDREMAYDVLQETLMQAWAKAHQLRDEASFLPWVFRIARNKANFYLKKRAKNYTRNINLGDDRDIDFMSHKGKNESAEDVALAQMDVEDARDYVRNLPPQIKQIVELHGDSEMTFAEIGKLLGMPTETVKSKYYRALRKFADHKEG